MKPILFCFKLRILWQAVERCSGLWFAPKDRAFGYIYRLSIATNNHQCATAAVFTESTFSLTLPSVKFPLFAYAFTQFAYAYNYDWLYIFWCHKYADVPTCFYSNKESYYYINTLINIYINYSFAKSEHIPNNREGVYTIERLKKLQ